MVSVLKVEGPQAVCRDGVWNTMAWMGNAGGAPATLPPIAPVCWRCVGDACHRLGPAFPIPRSLNRPYGFDIKASSDSPGTA